MSAGEIIAEYKKAFGATRFTDIRGPQWMKQRKSFLSAVSGRKVRSKEAGIASVEAVLFFQLPVGFGTECYAVVSRNIERLLS